MNPLGTFQPEGTEQSRLLCEEVSSRSGGICLLAFSRGKDAIAAWLWLRNFFHTIYPFHAAYYPHLEYVDRSLRYYETVFGTKIERCFDGEASNGLKYKWYQPIERYPLLNSLNRKTYTMEDIADVLRRKYNIHDAPMAQAISMHDNLFRRMNLRKLDDKGNLTYQGAFKPGYNTFYPTFDWTPTQVVETIKAAGVFLPDDYLTEAHSLTLIQLKNIERIMTLFPADFERAKGMFPLLKSMWARNQFRRMRVVGNGVVPRTVGEILREIRLQKIEADWVESDYGQREQ